MYVEELKRCSSCKKWKSLCYFHRNKSRKDGLCKHCKVCRKEIDRQSYIRNRDRKLQTIKQYGQTEKGKEVHIKSSKKYRQSNVEKCKAHHKLGKAIFKDKIQRPDKCSKCNKKCKPDGHHPDYNNLLKVVWLCRQCHKDLHRGD